jgi:hypothetical protein
MNVIEVTANDKYRIEGVLSDFHLRGKLSCFSKDCDLLALNVTNRSDKTARRDWYRALFAQMNYQHIHVVIYFDGVPMPDYPARGEIDSCFHDGRKAFKNTCIRRELLDIRRPDGTKVFLGAISGSGENDGKLQAYYHNTDATSAFVEGMCGNLPMYLSAYLRHVKGYSQRSIRAILAGASEQYRLRAPDCKWDASTRSITPLQEMGRSSFTSKMAAQNMTFLLPEVMAKYKKHSPNKHYSDEAKEAVAREFRFKNKGGYNPKEGDAASCLSENTRSTTGAQSNRSVTTTDIQCKLPELRIELHQLKDELRELSPQDELLNNELLNNIEIDNLSLGSSESAILAQLFKDTKQCLLLLKTRIASLKYEAPPPATNGSTDPSPSTREGSRGSVQGG